MLKGGAGIPILRDNRKDVWKGQNFLLERAKMLVDSVTSVSQDVVIKVLKLHPAAQLPRYAHTGPFGDLAADLYAVSGATLDAGATLTVATGVALEFPATHGALVEDRSGLAMRGITTLAGVIDPGYRGELKIVLTNLTSEPQMVAPGHRIAQLRIVERIQATFEETDMLAEA